MRILILGAGALGTAGALHLAEAGHDVTVFEARQVAGGTTGFAAGILSMALADPHDRHLTRQTIAAFDALGVDAPTPLLHRPGSHLLVAPGEEARVVDTIRHGLDEMGVANTRLAAAEWGDVMAARGIEATSGGVDHVLDLPGDAWALSTDATTRMATAAKQAGARFRTATVAGLLGAARATGVRLADGTHVEADAVVVALGAWSRDFLAAAGLRLPARGYRTHAAVLRSPLGARLPIVHDNAGCYYLRPESDDHVLVGNGTRTDPVGPDGFSNNAEPYFMEGIAARVPTRFPQLGAAGLQNAWRGILTGVPDKRPLVGRHPDRPGLFLLTGGNGFGFMRSHALGACLAAVVDDARPAGLPLDTLAWMDPARFWPDPPEAFPVMEGFQLLPPGHADG